MRPKKINSFILRNMSNEVQTILIKIFIIIYLSFSDSKILIHAIQSSNWLK